MIEQSLKIKLLERALIDGLDHGAAGFLDVSLRDIQVADRHLLVVRPVGVRATLRRDQDRLIDIERLRTRQSFISTIS